MSEKVTSSNQAARTLFGVNSLKISDLVKINPLTIASGVTLIGGVACGASASVGTPSPLPTPTENIASFNHVGSKVAALVIPSETPVAAINVLNSPIAIPTETPVAAINVLNSPIATPTETPVPNSAVSGSPLATPTQAVKSVDMVFVPIVMAPSQQIITTAPTETAAATPTEIDVYKTYLEGLGIKINLPRSDWPVTPEQAAEALKSTDLVTSIKPEQMTPIIETLPDGSKVWNGWIMGEPAFPMKSNIAYDAKLHVHVDTKTNQPEFDPQKIFKSFDDLTADEKTNFKTGLVDIKINQPGVAVYANKGGIVRDGDSEKNTKFFFGTPGSEVKGTEQITLIPVSSELCVFDPDLSGATKSFRQAAVEFRDNKDAQSGKAVVEWFNPETKAFEKLDGRLIAQLAKQGVNLTVLEKMPANAPLSPENMAHRFGGKAEKWVFEPKTGEWFYEAFNYKAGVHYVSGVGAVDQSGKVLFGMEQANSTKSKVFDFSQLDTAALVQDVNAPRSFQATLFARQGTMGNLATKNHSWYTWGKGNVTVKEPGIEQMTFMPNNPEWCAPADVPNDLAARAKTLATEQPDKAITALFWDGTQFQVVK